LRPGVEVIDLINDCMAPVAKGRSRAVDRHFRQRAGAALHVVGRPDILRGVSAALGERAPFVRLIFHL
jgi:hypothetical protein